MTDQPKQIVPTWVLLGAACFAFVAILDIPYGYYRLLRWVTCAVAIASAIQLHRSSRLSWVWALGGLAVLFNPIVPIHFERKIWMIFDGVAGCFFLVVLFLTRKDTEEANKTRHSNPH
jgi:predicted lysophospholipase L1 biosynthesis ABC-type transport system permease subunit